MSALCLLIALSQNMNIPKHEIELSKTIAKVCLCKFEEIKYNTTCINYHVI